MARWISIAALIALLASASGAQTPGNSTRDWNMGRIDDLVASPDRRSTQPGSAKIIAGTEIMPNVRFGLGFFGIKAERSRVAPVTVREITEPKTRKAGLGLSLKF